MWVFRSKPAEEEEYEDEEGSEYEDEDEDDEEQYPEFGYGTGEEGDDEKSKYKKSGRPPIVPLGKDVLSEADSSVQTDNNTAAAAAAAAVSTTHTRDTANNNGTNSRNSNSNSNSNSSNEESQKHLVESPRQSRSAKTTDAVKQQPHAAKQPETGKHANKQETDATEAKNGNGNGKLHGNGYNVGKGKGKGENNGRADKHDNNEEEEEEEEDHDMDTVVVDNDDDMLDDGIPENVQVDDSHHSRNRAPSALSVSGIDYSDDEEQAEEEEEEIEEKEKEEEPEEEEEQVTSMAEKQSLLVLAAEHDRVDILQAILSDDGSKDRSVLLHATSSTSIPPLHIAVGYGSVGATNCLLRMGADPSLRPNVAAIQKEQKRQESPVEISNMARYDNVSAWELAFGCGDGIGTDKKAGWSLFGSPSSKAKVVVEDDDDDDNDEDPEEGGLSDSIRSKKSTRSARKPPRNVAPVTMAPSKREGIRHAFTAEALRCIGADEVDRLRQLVDSGMPMSIDIGGKNLYDWSVEMSASECEILLRPSEAERHGETTKVVASNDNNDSDKQHTGGDSNTTAISSSNKKTAVLDRPGDEPAMHLVNRLDELESLSKALSICLDNLAEEVSVSHGLLLMGGGAAALASHVRGLKALKERKYEELVRMQEAWENSVDELAYWVKESGDQGKRIADLMTSSLAASLTRRTGLPEATSPEEERAQTQQLQAQIGASDYKIRKLRVAIADLSEDNARNLKEVEKRGLSGGINLVRGLREEIRDTEFELSEAKSEEATCRTKISMIQSSLLSTKKQPHPKTNKQDIYSIPEEPVDDRLAQEAATAVDSFYQASAAESTDQAKNFSERIATGESTAIVVRVPGNRGFFPVSLWHMILRIIGMGEGPPPRTNDSSIARTTMII